MNAKTLFSTILLSITGSSYLSATIIAQDDFSYTSGADLNGQSGGSGWLTGSGTTTWLAATGSTANVTIQSNNGSTAAQFAGTSPNSNDFASRPLATPFGDGANENLIFISYTLEIGQTPGSDFFALWLDTTQNPGNSHSGQRMNMGLGTGDNLFSRLDTNSGDSVNGPAASSNTTYHMVAEYSKSTPGASNSFDTLRFWVNPENGDLGTPIGTVSRSNPTQFQWVGFRGAVNETGDTFFVDNLVLATEWSDVVVIPEPASLLLFASGMGLVALVMKRRS